MALDELLRERGALQQFRHNAMFGVRSSSMYPASLAYWITNAFTWNTTPEGFDYWEGISSQMEERIKLKEQTLNVTTIWT